jgi:hypothetical protein
LKQALEDRGLFGNVPLKRPALLEQLSNVRNHLCRLAVTVEFFNGLLALSRLPTVGKTFKTGENFV